MESKTIVRQFPDIIGIEIECWVILFYMFRRVLLYVAKPIIIIILSWG